MAWSIDMTIRTLIGAALMASFVAACVGDAAGTAATLSSPFAYPDPRPAPRLQLVDHDGRSFDLAGLRGETVLVYFGYTQCPDVCPATVGTLNTVIAAAPDPLRVVFVTVDPARDTVTALGDYVRYLSPEYVGLTGSATEIRTAADDWGVSYARVDGGSASGYAMAHTAATFLVDASGQLLANYPFGTEAEAILRDLAALASR
jgi:protein SCO1/2